MLRYAFAVFGSKTIAHTPTCYLHKWWTAFPDGLKHVHSPLQAIHAAHKLTSWVVNVSPIVLCLTPQLIDCLTGCKAVPSLLLKLFLRKRNLVACQQGGLVRENGLCCHQVHRASLSVRRVWGGMVCNWNGVWPLFKGGPANVGSDQRAHASEHV